MGNEEKILFKEYYNQLEPTARIALRDQIVPTYMGYSSFYSKVTNNDFSTLEFEKLEMLTTKSFIKND